MVSYSGTSKFGAVLSVKAIPIYEMLSPLIILFL